MKKRINKIQNREPKIIGNLFIILSLVAMIYSIRAFSDSHPLRATFLTLDSAVFLLCAVGLRQQWRWTVYVFTLFWINAGVTYYLTIEAGLKHEPLYLAIIAAILAVYYLTVFRNWKGFKTIAPNQGDAPGDKAPQ